MRKVKFDEVKIAKNRLVSVLEEMTPVRAMAGLNGVDYYIASLWKPKIIFDGDIIWFAKSKENGIMLNIKAVKSVIKKDRELIIETVNGLKYEVL